MDDVEMEEVDEMLATIERLKAENHRLVVERDKLADFLVREMPNTARGNRTPLWSARLRRQCGSVIWKSFPTKSEAIEAVFRAAGIDP
jgi:regulator of replication initiation timing